MQIKSVLLTLAAALTVLSSSAYAKDLKIGLSIEIYA